jgi:hypothetical protein
VPSVLVTGPGTAKKAFVQHLEGRGWPAVGRSWCVTPSRPTSTG